MHGATIIAKYCDETSAPTLQTRNDFTQAHLPTEI